MKHVRVANHQVQQYVDEGEVSIHTVGTEENIADVFTKALARERHEKLTEALGLIPLPQSLQHQVGLASRGSVGDHGPNG